MLKITTQRPFQYLRCKLFRRATVFPPEKHFCHLITKLLFSFSCLETRQEKFLPPRNLATDKAEAKRDNARTCELNKVGVRGLALSTIQVKEQRRVKFQKPNRCDELECFVGFAEGNSKART